MSAVLADFPVLTPVTDEDLAFAAHAARVHALGPWPQGSCAAAKASRTRAAWPAGPRPRSTPRA